MPIKPRDQLRVFILGLPYHFIIVVASPGTSFRIQDRQRQGCPSEFDDFATAISRYHLVAYRRLVR